MHPPPSPYWAQIPQPAQIDAMRDKYLALERLCALRGEEHDAARRQALRAVARRWPAALREAELVHPDVVAMRMMWANTLPKRWPRSRWREEGAKAVVLWADLHDLLSDQLTVRRRFRASRNAKPVLPVEQFVAQLLPGAQARWPDAETLADLCGPTVRPRQAYLWLAAQSGMTLPQLHFALFAREGHWDRRPGDPDWAHAQGPDRDRDLG